MKNMPVPLISVDNKLSSASFFFTEFFVKNKDKDLKNYLYWLDSEVNPPKSYRDHPIQSEQQLNQFKRLFEKTVGISLGAYLRIKRAYFLLNQPKFNQTEAQDQTKCEFCYVDTPIGRMLAIFVESKLCLLEFLERKMLETELKDIQKSKKCQFVFKQSEAYQNLQTQLNEYFSGSLQQFEVALDTVGTDFQQKVWQALQTIDYGTTISYQDEAEKMGKPTAMRAVANANGKNKISIVIPCHRVIRKSGELGGYGGGLWRKQFLLALEQMV